MGRVKDDFAKTTARIPSVVGENQDKARTDVFSHLAENRVIMLTGPINQDTEDRIVAQLLFLEMMNPEEDIKMYISSPGGIVTSALAIYDVMQSVKPDIATYCAGQAMSAASLLLCAGTEGKRNLYPNTSVMVHQPSGGARGKFTDIDIQTAHGKTLEKRLLNIYKKHTGKDIKTIRAEWKDDNYMSAKEAIEWGLADNIVKSTRRLTKKKAPPVTPSPS